MRVLVTGASGFVGGYMLAELAAHGHEPIALDRNATGNPDISWAACDLLDRTAVNAALARSRPAGCIHLAGIAFVPEGDARPNSMLSVNVMGTLNLLDSFRALLPESRVLSVSTAHVYGQTPPGPALNEESPLRPVTLYAISKSAADVAALAYAQTWGLRVMTARPNNHTGPGQSGNFVVPGLIRQAKAFAEGTAQGPIRAGNLDSERDFTDVRDVVRAYRLLLEAGRPGLAYNIGSGTNVPIRHIFDRICLLLGIRPEIEVAVDRFRPKDRSPILDLSRIREHTGWQPEIGLDRTLRDMLAEDGIAAGIPR